MGKSELEVLQRACSILDEIDKTRTKEKRCPLWGVFYDFVVDNMEDYPWEEVVGNVFEVVLAHLSEHRDISFSYEGGLSAKSCMVASYLRRRVEDLAGEDRPPKTFSF